MNRNALSVWITAAVLGLGAVTAQAQTAPQPQMPASAPQAHGAHGPHGQGAHAKKAHRPDAAQWAERHAQRMEALKQKLNLSAAQQVAWANYQAAVTPAPRAKAERQPGERMARAQLTTPQRLDVMTQRQTERLAQWRARAEATKAFYAQLTPEQQKVFDAETARPPHAKGKRPHRRGQGHAPAAPASAS